MEETCVRTPEQVKVLGVVKGLCHLRPFRLYRVSCNNNMGCYLSAVDKPKLHHFLKELHLLYYPRLELAFCRYLADTGGPTISLVRRFCGYGEEYWTRLWDDCYENYGTGKIKYEIKFHS